MFAWPFDKKFYLLIGEDGFIAEYDWSISYGVILMIILIFWRKKIRFLNKNIESIENIQIDLVSRAFFDIFS